MVVSHPKFVKAIKGKKTDKKDAQWIADLFKHDLVRGSFIHLRISGSFEIFVVTGSSFRPT